MNAKLLSPSLVMAMGISAAVAADQSSSTVPSKQEDRKIEQIVGEEVGRSAFDGITVAGGQAFVTRNGKTEELMEPLVLDDGTKIQPDGTIKTAAGRDITLKQNQVLRFNGKIAIIPVDSDPAPATTPQFSTTTSGNVVGAVAGAPATTGGGSSGVSGSASIGGSGNVGASGVVSDSGVSFSSIPTVIAPGTATTTQGNSLIASDITTDPRTGQLVLSARDPVTGQTVRTTTDPRTNQTISTTTVNGQQVSTTTNPQTGLPVTITTNSSGRTTATTLDPATGQQVPIQYNPLTGEISGGTQQSSPQLNQQGRNLQPTQAPTQTTTTQQLPGTTTGTATGTAPTTSGSGTTRSGTSGGTTSGGNTSGSSGGTSGGATGGGR